MLAKKLVCNLILIVCLLFCIGVLLLNILISQEIYQNIQFDYKYSLGENLCMMYSVLELICLVMATRILSFKRTDDFFCLIIDDLLQIFG
jgi:hypothetical protein